jgi:hypothetical protein
MRSAEIRELTMLEDLNMINKGFLSYRGKIRGELTITYILITSLFYFYINILTLPFFYLS